MKRISELVKNKHIMINPFLHGAIFSRIIQSKCNNFFLIPSNFKESKFTKETISDTTINEYVNSLNNISSTKTNCWISRNEFDKNFHNISWETNNSTLKAAFIIENDIKITKSEFLKLIYYNLLMNNNYLLENEFNDDKRLFLSGFMEPRGSIDLKANFISIDYFYDNLFELKRIKIFIDYSFIPPKIMNLNFRELQQQFINGTNKRNTQFRLKLDWYIKNIGLLNKYKKSIISQNITNKVIKNKDFYYFNIMDKIYEFDEDDYSIDSKLAFYSKNILNKTIDPLEIYEIKKKLFSNNKIKNKRNQFIKEVCRLTKENECSGCFDKYSIKDRTFIHLKTNTYYLEIHHNIPFSKGKEYDVLENLVKLCPTCHKLLRKGICDESTQKNVIKNILLKNQDTQEFASMVFNINKEDIDILVNKIYSMLL